MRSLAPLRRFTLGLALALFAAPAWAQLAPLPYDQGGVGLGLALRRLPSTARVLVVTAHPDDEDNAALVALSRGRGLATALLTLTRGEGGQNAIGPELFEALGVLRTEELLAVHRYDGVRQYFSGAYEFGFSFSLEETLAKWGHQETLGDVVRVVRSFRPDVILTLPLEARGHQHHTAAARLAVEAFRAAADPDRFPEQLSQGLRPWQARKVYQGGVGGEGGAPPLGEVALEIGRDDPLLGMSWAELGSLARSFHRCQAVGQLRALPGEREPARYVLVDAEPRPSGPEADILDGIDTTLSGLLHLVGEPERARVEPGLGAVDAAVRSALASFDAREPGRSVAPLAAGLAALRRLEEATPASGASAELRFRLAEKEHDFVAALALAQGLFLEATSEDGDVVPGQTFAVTVHAFNRGAGPVRIEALELKSPRGWDVRAAPGDPASPEGSTLAPASGLVRRFAVTVSREARFSQPYWKRLAGLDRYQVEIPEDRGLPFAPPEVAVSLRALVDGVPLALERGVVRRYEGRWVGGEKQKVVNVVPALSVSVTPELAVFPLGPGRASRELRVSASSNLEGETAASLRLEAPRGWSVEPGEVALLFRFAGETATARFTVTPPAALAPGESTLSAVATLGTQEFREGYQAIAYDHIQERHLFHRAAARALALDVRVRPGVRVGYVMGAGDEVAEAIRQLGVPVTPLGPDDLAFSDLDRYSTIVTGVRAYHARPDLRSHQDRLMRYVERGGHLLVQYNRWEFNQLVDTPAPEAAPAGATSPFAPYPARVTTARITDENAAMEILVPDHPAVTSPNRITEADWQGWVQERGIQFLETEDPRYFELLAAADPFPLNPGRKTGILVEARVGRGTWTYTGLVLFRELPAGVPGAYRLLANLISRPRGAAGPRRGDP